MRLESSDKCPLLLLRPNRFFKALRSAVSWYVVQCRIRRLLELRRVRLSSRKLRM